MPRLGLRQSAGRLRKVAQHPCVYAGTGLTAKGSRRRPHPLREEVGAAGSGRSSPAGSAPERSDGRSSLDEVV